MLDLTNRKTGKELEALPRPTNEALRKMFAEVDGVVIKGGGVYKDKAVTDDVVLVITTPDKIERLSELLEIDEAAGYFYCMCWGDHTIELHTKNQLKYTIGFHHGVSIRYDQWSSDASLAQSDELLHFLASLGLTKPLTDRLEAKRNSEPDKVAEREWLAVAPRCFSTYWSQINSIDKSYREPLMLALNAELPDQNERLIRLLQTYGKTNSFWNAYPVYEDIPLGILLTYSVQEIITAYLFCDRNYKTRRGLGRYLCSSNIKKNRHAHLGAITAEVLDDIEKCFVVLKEERGIREIALLKQEKGNC